MPSGRPGGQLRGAPEPGPAQGHVGQRTDCRRAALGGHVVRCHGLCPHPRSPTTRAATGTAPSVRGEPPSLARGARGGTAAGRVLPRGVHLAGTLGALAYQNKARIYDLLFDVAAETLPTIAADPRHLGARIGMTLVLHTWGPTLDHHPHVHGIVPAGGLSPDGARWVACRPGFFLPVRVLSRWFRRRFLEGLAEAHAAGRSSSSASTPAWLEAAAFTECLGPCAVGNGWSMPSPPSPDPKRCSPTSPATPTGWRSPTAGSSALDRGGVSFRWKDYRANGRCVQDDAARAQRSSCADSCCTCCRAALTASATMDYSPMPGAGKIFARARELLHVVPDAKPQEDNAPGAIPQTTFLCPNCGATMIIIEILTRRQPIRAPPHPRDAA